MAPRRFIALIVSAALLHLSSARADAVCVQHDAHAGATAGAHQESTGPLHDHADAAKSIDDEACETPTLPECCQALATCSTTLGDQGSLRVDHSYSLHASVDAALESAPLSRVASPEPPPPKL